MLILTDLTTMRLEVDNMEAAAITVMVVTTGDTEVAAKADMAAMEVVEVAMVATVVAAEVASVEAVEAASEAAEVDTEDMDSAPLAMVVAEEDTAAVDSELAVDTLVLEEDSVATVAMELEDMAVMVSVDTEDHAMEDTTGAVEINFVNWIYSLVDAFNE